MSEGTIQIDVTQAHIDNGVRSEPESCPIALALWDYGARGVFVDHDRVLVDEAEYVMPRNGQDFIEAFDMGDPVAPLHLELVPVEPEEEELR
jgi:hypothetical protein